MDYRGQYECSRVIPGDVNTQPRYNSSSRQIVTGWNRTYDLVREKEGYRAARARSQRESIAVRVSVKRRAGRAELALSLESRISGWRSY